MPFRVFRNNQFTHIGIKIQTDPTTPTKNNINRLQLCNDAAGGIEERVCQPGSRNSEKSTFD